MKNSIHLLTITALAAFAAFSLRAFTTATMNKETTDGAGHVYVALWKKYAEAERKDLPATQLSILSQIKSQALAERQAWDWWCAAGEYVDVSVQRDWKRRDSLRKALAEEVSAFADPCVSFAYALSRRPSAEAFSVLKGNEASMRASSHPPFWQDALGSMLGGRLCDYVESDYEWGLWSLRSSVPEADSLLAAELGDGYPLAAYRDFLEADALPLKGKGGSAGRMVALREVAHRHCGKAVALYPRLSLLRLELDSLQSDGAGEEAYKALYAKTGQFSKDFAAFSGEEAQLAKGLDKECAGVRETLESKELGVLVKDGEAVVTFRNLSSAELTLYRDGGEKILTKGLRNPVGSFYVPDTVRVELPIADDGTYRVAVECGKVASEVTYGKYTLSVARRRDSRGVGIYVADYKTGEPLSKADIRLSGNGSTVLSVEDFPLGDGFTQLPEDFQSMLGGSSYYEITAEARSADGSVRLSNALGAGRSYAAGSQSSKSALRATLLTDRGAYKPGDTLSFKAVLYEGDMLSSVSAASEGRAVTVTFSDSEGNPISRKQLATNDFGSVAGEFAVPFGLRGGMFSLSVVSDGGQLASRHVRVDEFLLPSFDLEFDSDEAIHVPGDTVVVRGRLSSYSGHSLSSAVVGYVAKFGGEVLAEGSLTPDGDGGFEISVPSALDNWQPIAITANVMDGTGETQEFTTSVFVGTHFSIDVEPMDGTGDELTLADSPDSSPRYGRYGSQVTVLREGHARFLVEAHGNGGKVRMGLSYVLRDGNDAVVASGSVFSGDTLSLGGIGGGLHVLTVGGKIDPSRIPEGLDLDGDALSAETSHRILRIEPESGSLDAKADAYFCAGTTEIGDGGRIQAYAGASSHPVWGIAELYGEGRKLLDARTFHLSGEEGNCIQSLSYGYEASWPDAVMLQVFWFADGQAKTWRSEYRRLREGLDLPLEFTSFEDRTLPRARRTVTIRTEPDVEALAAVFDKASERINPNSWGVVRLRDASVPSVGIGYQCGGEDGGDYGDIVLYSRSMAASAGSAKNAVMATMDMAEDAVEEEAAEASGVGDAEATVRSDMASTLTFQPFLRSSAGGDLSFDFETSDKLSTYVVAVWAHDRGLRNASLRRDMVVTLPVKVAVSEPQYLYAGDSCSLAVTVSSNAERPVSGKLSVYQYDGLDYAASDPVGVRTVDVTVPAGGTVARQFEIAVPQVLPHELQGGVASAAGSSGAAAIGLKAVFVADAFSDGVFVGIPVRPAAQTLTEAHSAVLLSGDDKAVAEASLRSSFVNMDGKQADLREISVLDMIREALPSKVEPASDDVLSLSEAWYVRLVAESLGSHIDVELPTARLWERVLACRNADGGFGWFEGMSSSPVITAVLLERFAKASKAGLMTEDVDLTSAVKFLDDSYFGLERPLWCGGLSTDQYLYVRSLYPQVAFEVSASGSKAVFDKRLSEFRKYVRKYLTPADTRGLSGQVFAKARRLMTLSGLLDGGASGLALANGWGLSISASGKLRRSLEADVASLLEYAVPHGGGVYCPNFVMPWRGLLEDEAYAHSMMSDLMDGYARGGSDSDKCAEARNVADGIRLWLMLQKETQQWDASPAFVDAIASVMAGSDEVKATSVLALSGSYEAPFEQVEAAGNGFSIERRFLRDGSEIADGTALERGDRIVAEYRIWNGENRSFVRISAPREATLRPVDQLSGHYGHGLRRMGASVGYTFTPSGYRDVRVDRTLLYFDAYPEENTTLTEEFFVTQSGVFHAPAIEVESLYAPHYRANSAAATPLTVR